MAQARAQSDDRGESKRPSDLTEINRKAAQAGAEATKASKTKRSSSDD